MSLILKDLQSAIVMDGDKRKFAIILALQNPIIQPGRKELDSYQFNMAFNEFEDSENVITGLRAFADYLEEKFNNQSKPKLIGL